MVWLSEQKQWLYPPQNSKENWWSKYKCKYMTWMFAFTFLFIYVDLFFNYFDFFFFFVPLFLSSSLNNISEQLKQGKKSLFTEVIMIYNQIQTTYTIPYTNSLQCLMECTIGNSNKYSDMYSNKINRWAGCVWKDVRISPCRMTYYTRASSNLQHIAF